MQKWADYLISAVKTNPNQPRVDMLEVHSDFGRMVCKNEVFSRADVIANIKRGVTYATASRTTVGKWRKGKAVNLVTVNGEEYLRTDRKSIAQDQFDNVPEL